MKISLNEIKKLVKIPESVSTEELVKLIGARLVEVEGTDDWAPKYRGIKIVKVVSCEAIPDTHLHLCQIDAGETDLVQVVCGAPNVHADMFAVWIAPGCIVPETYGTDEPFEISSRRLRGYMSSGMLSAADELGLGADHDGIIEIDPEMTFNPSGEKTARKIKPGDSFAEVFDLNDVILDIENKSLTHRPDTFGLVGFAREVAGILGVKFEEPEYILNPTGLKLTNDIEIKTDNELCPRYSCAVMEFEDTPHSPYFTLDDVFLIKADMRPISPIVDATNIIMLRTGQPLHAFDYDKFVYAGKSDKPKIIVRAAKEGEKIELIDGKTIACDSNDILITSNDVPVALAGAMGGKNTEIDETTKHIIIESASFSLYHLRKTQMKHGIFSEAITRFTKGQPAGQTLAVLGEIVKLLGGKTTSVSDEYPDPAVAPEISLTLDDINSLLGTKYDYETVKKTLENVNLKVEGDASKIKVQTPYWRTDLHIREDIIEEVGRLLGYDNIAIDFPKRPFIGAKQAPLLVLKNKIRDILADKLNANEVLTYSFVSEKLQEKAGEDPENSYKIVNSISPELQCFRQSITPSLIEKTYENIKAGYKDFTLFEINQVTNKKDGLNDEKVPVMHTNLALVTLGDYYLAKKYLSELLKQLGLSEEVILEVLKGHVFAVKGSILKRFKIEQPVSGFEIDLEKLLAIIPATSVKKFKFSRFPATERDVTFAVSKDTPFGDVEKALNEAFDGKELLVTIKPVSIYEPEENLKKIKNLSFHLSIAHPEKTLNGDEISVIMDEVTKHVCKVSGGAVI